MTVKIPDRNTSKYARQYAGAFDAERIAQIFADSRKIALSSKNPSTAADRFELAVEAYHQVMSMATPAALRDAVQEAMEALVEAFPARVAFNEALGLLEKARKLKTAGKRLVLLRQALDIVERGLADHPSSSELQSAVIELRAELSGAAPLGG